MVQIKDAIQKSIDWEEENIEKCNERIKKLKIWSDFFGSKVSLHIGLASFHGGSSAEFRVDLEQARYLVDFLKLCIGSGTFISNNAEYIQWIGCGKEIRIYVNTLSPIDQLKALCNI